MNTPPHIMFLMPFNALTQSISYMKTKTSASKHYQTFLNPIKTLRSNRELHLQEVQNRIQTSTSTLVNCLLLSSFERNPFHSFVNKFAYPELFGSAWTGSTPVPPVNVSRSGVQYVNDDKI